jgi:hypothetical protein
MADSASNILLASPERPLGCSSLRFQVFPTVLETVMLIMVVRRRPEVCSLRLMAHVAGKPETGSGTKRDLERGLLALCRGNCLLDQHHSQHINLFVVSNAIAPAGVMDNQVC